MSLVGRWVSIQSFKHDGSFHRFWDRGLMLEDTRDYVVIATKKAKVTESNGRKWFTKEPAVTIFSKKDWWNVICMIKNNGICYYCNIASPCVVEQACIKYIDYDLDVKLLPDKKIRLLDEKEYEHHKLTYSYGEDLDTVLRYVNSQIVEMMKKNVFPFNDEKIKEYYQKLLEYFDK